MSKEPKYNFAPGRRLDVMVATEIMGNKVIDDDILGPLEMYTSTNGENIYHPLRAYSSDIASARMVVGKMTKAPFHDEVAYWGTDSRPDVICKAALRAVRQKRKTEEALQKRALVKVIK